MINQGNNVPDKTIAVFGDLFDAPWHFNNKERLYNIVDKSPKKRDWFTPHFYRCLPLTIGNQYGFIIKSEFDFSFIWDGGSSKDSLKFIFNETTKELEEKHPRIDSHFGEGIITIGVPFTLRTPPGINIMTINPPNYIIPNVTVMTGVIETDNLRRNFTFNLKVQTPNIEVKIPAGTPLAGFIPIPRYFADSFELKYAEDIFDEEVILEELQAEKDANYYRRQIEEPLLKHGVGKLYMQGKDIYGNLFPDHQKP
jgi:hypothetical protein